MILLQYLTNETTPGYPDQSAVEWLVILQWAAILLTAIVAAWVIFNTMFNHKWKENFARAIMSGHLEEKNKNYGNNYGLYHL